MTAIDVNALKTDEAVLLVDDYIGSGSTMKEAARVAHKECNFKKNIVPFAIASVKWRLGKAGMI